MNINNESPHAHQFSPIIRISGAGVAPEVRATPVLLVGLTDLRHTRGWGVRSADWVLLGASKLHRIVVGAREKRGTPEDTAVVAPVLSRTPPRWVKWFCPLLSIRGPIPVHPPQICPRPRSRLDNGLPPNSFGETRDVAPAPPPTSLRLAPALALLSPAQPCSPCPLPSSLLSLLFFPSFSFLPACLPARCYSVSRSQHGFLEPAPLG